MTHKVGILKIGANITQSKAIKTASNLDIFSLAEILLEHNMEVTIITKKTRNTIIDSRYEVVDIMDYFKNEKGLDIDTLLVFNGAINFFGGAESPEMIENFRIMKSCPNVHYVLTDCRFPLRQIWPSIWKREWAGNYTNDMHIDSINYIYQGTDHEKLRKLVNKTKDAVPIKESRTLNIPWAVMLGKRTVYPKPYHEREYDLFYGGANRDTYRAKRFKMFYSWFGVLKVMIAGSIRTDFTVTKKIGAIPNNSFIRTMSNAKATVIIGDQFYCNNYYTLRMFESIFAGCITFIDTQFDTKRLFYSGINDPDIRNFLYVNNDKDLSDRFTVLKNMSEEQIKNIRIHQMKALTSLEGAHPFKRKLIDIVLGE